MADNDIKIGVSACVIGEKVRFDSGHKINNFLTKDFSEYVRFVAVCPEVGIGLPVPRPTIRLISNEERVALVESKNPDVEYTTRMMDYSENKVEQLIPENLCGYVVCAKSPTCGMERVKVYKKNSADKNGIGLYTKVLMEKMPWLPVEEDGRLLDQVLKENFIARVYALHDFYQSMGGKPTPGKIVQFHSRYKLSLMAHHPQSYREIGRLVANIKHYDSEAFYIQYRNQFMNALKNRASRKNTTNVLMHLQGYFKRDLDPAQKRELADIILEYRQGLLPLLAPLTLIKHYLKAYPDQYIKTQRFLDPYPQELRLRYGL